MPKKLCIIHANCQGDTLKFLLESCPSFYSEYTIKKYTNYLQEHIAAEELESCQLFLYQHLGQQWHEAASANLLHKLPSSAHTLCIPNMFFNGYWPLWTNNTFMAYGDMLLEDLCTKELSPAEILHLYMKSRMYSTYDFEALRLQSLTKERIKETYSPITTLDFIEEHWRNKQLFHTVNHPAPPLSLYVADKILAQLGHSPVPLATRQQLLAHEEEFILPIHSSVAAQYDLAFAPPTRLYPVYGQSLSMQSYAAAYIQCRLQKGADAIKDFVVYLHLLAQGAQKTCSI